MARQQTTKPREPLPPPLPPETRTVGQLVAESIRLYGSWFVPSLSLGASVAIVDEVALGRDTAVQTLILWLGSPLLTASYVGAVAIAAKTSAVSRSAATAFLVGLLVFAPVPALIRFYILPAIAWLALFGLAVPAAVVEHLGFRDALARGRRLGSVDYVHALGSLVTLAILYFLTRIVLLFLLRSQGDAAVRTAGFLADLVISPLLFLGAALLYFDQAARVVRSRSRS